MGRIEASSSGGIVQPGIYFLNARKPAVARISEAARARAALYIAGCPRARGDRRFRVKVIEEEFQWVE